MTDRRQQPSSVLLEVDVPERKFSAYLLDPFLALLRGFDKNVQIALTRPPSQPYINCSHAAPTTSTNQVESALPETRPSKRRRKSQAIPNLSLSSQPDQKDQQPQSFPRSGTELEVIHHASIKSDIQSAINVIRDEWIKQCALRGHSEWWSDPDLLQHPSLAKLVWTPSHVKTSVDWAALTRDTLTSRMAQFDSLQSSIRVSESGITCVNSSSNSSKRFLVAQKNCTVILPIRSGFTLATMEKFERGVLELKHPSAWDAVIIDPPWQNKSAARGQKYRSIELYDLFKLNLPRILGDNMGKEALIAIWVTNRPKFRRFLKTKFLPDCHVNGPYSDWYWVKITASPMEQDQLNLIKGGKPLFDLESSSPRRCYEGLVLGWYRPPALRSNPPSKPLPSKVFLSVPLDHSRKPNVLDLIQPHLPSDPSILELFARSVSGLGNVSAQPESDSSGITHKGRWHSVGDESPKFMVPPWVDSHVDNQPHNDIV